MADRIAFQGEPGAYSHQACHQAYPEMEAVACPTFEDTIETVRKGNALLAMLPVENSTYGRVADIHHLLPESGLHIIGEYFLPIRFQLMAIKGARIDQLTDVYSHVHALGQCRRIIRQYGLKAHVFGDTAGSARQIAEWRNPTRAALAPKLAASIYDLDILAENVEDAAHNTTRFVILSKQKDWCAPQNGPTVTSFVFRVRNVPAALYKALGGFATNGVNMTKLESYMLEGEFTATQFLADVDGHPDDRGLKLALEELEFFSKEVRILGVYPAHPFRIEAQKKAG